MKIDRIISNDQHKSWFERIAQAFNDKLRNSENVVKLSEKAVKPDIVDRDAFTIIEGALEVSEVQPRDIMIPPSQMVVVKSEDDPKISIRKIINSSHSRFPVVRKKLDKILSVLLDKDLLPLLFKEENIVIKTRMSK